MPNVHPQCFIADRLSIERCLATLRLVFSLATMGDSTIASVWAAKRHQKASRSGLAGEVQIKISKLYLSGLGSKNSRHPTADILPHIPGIVKRAARPLGGQCTLTGWRGRGASRSSTRLSWRLQKSTVRTGGGGGSPSVASPLRNDDLTAAIAPLPARVVRLDKWLYNRAQRDRAPEMPKTLGGVPYDRRLSEASC